MGRLHPRAHFLDLQVANGHTSTTTTTTLISATPASYFALKSDIPKLQLPPREEPTRVQLQRQRLRDQHKRHIVRTTIPGIKTSAAFFNSLRTNLSLHAAPPPPSPISTPNSMRGSAASLPPPSPLSTPMAENEVSVPEDPLAGVPELKSYIPTEEEERLDGLNLIADSVAQQRQAANNALIYHPINLSVMSGVFAITIKIMKDLKYDGLAAAMTCMGIFMIWLILCRYLSAGYLNAAESINWKWAGEQHDLIITKFGEEVIGALIIEWVTGDNKKRGKKAWRGQIRGWTVKLKYRGKGVGVALLEDAVKETKKKGADSLEFADDHANSKRFLPKLYNAEMDKSDAKGRVLLANLLETTPTKGKKK